MAQMKDNNAAFWEALIRGMAPVPSTKEDKQLGFLAFLLFVLAVLLSP